MYKQVKNIFGEIVALQRNDGWQIPIDPDNSDYQQYLKWLEAGNHPLSPEEN